MLECGLRSTKGGNQATRNDRKRRQGFLGHVKTREHDTTSKQGRQHSQENSLALEISICEKPDLFILSFKNFNFTYSSASNSSITNLQKLKSPSKSEY